MSAKSVEGLKEDFPDIDEKTLFRSHAVTRGVKAPVNAPPGMTNSAPVQHQVDSSSFVGLAEKHGYVRPSQRQQAQNQFYQQPVQQQMTAQYQQQWQQPVQQYYQQYAQPPMPQVDVTPYKGAIDGLLELLSHKLTHAEWVMNPAIANALRMLQ